ncbi:hypothetical protein HBB16_12405 [Pseudonocardia sp. MCCB 268]|nr:hypothetical protein [Pseudonocardia cytotoxica]
MRIGVHTVGICGSDVHYYTHGRIGPYVVERPHGAGPRSIRRTVTETGADVTWPWATRVLLERASPIPLAYPPAWASTTSIPACGSRPPPVDGCLQPGIIHPADFTYRL